MFVAWVFLPPKVLGCLYLLANNPSACGAVYFFNVAGTFNLIFLPRPSSPAAVPRPKPASNNSLLQLSFCLPKHGGTQLG